MNFVIPSERAELLHVGNGYYIRDTLMLNEINPRLKDCRVLLRDEGAEYILDAFPVYYSVLHHSKELQMNVIYTAYEDLQRAINVLNQSLGFLLEDKESITNEVKVKYLDVTKMLVYAYVQVVLFIEHKVDGKLQYGNGKNRKKSDSTDVSLNKKAILLALNNIVQRDIRLFWDPPVVEESFTRLVADVAYNFLQNPSVKREKEVLEAIFNLFGTLIVDYNHGTTFSIKIVQLIKMHEHLVSCIPEGVQLMVRNLNCRGLVHTLVREITMWQTDEKFEDSHGGRYCSQILSELSVLMPDLIIPEITYLMKYLEHESPTLRNCILNVITEVILRVFSHHQLSDEDKESKEDFFEVLHTHTNDLATHVRANCIKQVSRLQKANAIPMDKQNDLLKACILHLTDKSALVRKSAIQCVTLFLSHNMFSAELSLKQMREELEIKGKSLEEMIKNFEEVKRERMQKIDEDWDKMAADLKATIEAELQNNMDVDKDNETQLPMEGLGNLVQIYLSAGKYKDAFHICHKSGNDIQEFQQLREQREHDDVDLYMLVMKMMFANDRNIAEDFEEIKKIQAEVEFLTESVTFLEMVDACFDVMVELLETTAISDMQEAIHFFIAAYQFKIDKADSVGVLGMLRIMKRNEPERKDLVIDAFKTIYLTTDAKSITDHTTEIVKRLLVLLRNIPHENYDDLQLIISEWTAKGVLDNSIIDTLWQYFTRKISVLDADCLGAAELLRMAALGRRTIITRNIKVVATVGFKGLGETDMAFLGSCCDLLAVAGREKFDVDSPEPPSRIKPHDEIFQDLVEVLMENFFKPVDFYHKALSGGINCIFKLCSNPEVLCESMILRIFKQLFGDTPGDMGDVTLDNYVVARVCQLMGFVALKQLEYLDQTVHGELKRRNNVRKARKEGQKTQKKTPGRNLNATQSLDDSVLEGAQAEDAEAEFIINMLEKHTVTGSGGLAKLAYFVINICQRPNDYSDVMVQGSAVIALIRFMLVSSQFCEENIQLLFTIFEKTIHPEVKCNILLHLSDLLIRFPNVVEPWTPRMFERLKDPLPGIRRATFFTLSNLILGDMIRAHSYISQMVICMMDEDQEVRAMAKTFLITWANKEDNLYSVVTDVFSALMDLEGIQDDKLREIMKFLFSLMGKTKHVESLVERFCAKFCLSEDLRYQRNVAYCLTMIQYNEKALTKLLENFPTYKDMVHDANIYASFKEIFSNCNKTPVGGKDLKPIVAEIENAIQSVFEVTDGKMRPPPVPRAKKSTKGKPTKKQTKKRRQIESESDSD